ncbi:unnamed protein product [Arctia plantaginis]|uniref:Uncharacterized protein n=1 Tax=Arctia plantaginis TaxID=874455 RepID=A0A8S0ZDZ4_ARCPL|nr:unnamed protein product [Arctia plantaginis]
MSEYYREQHPLLCEEGSEEELYSPRYYRRVHPTAFRGRARINHKGAAAIFTRWPDHWSSFLTYWWIAIGMISLTIFVIYNSLFAFSMLSSVDTKPAYSIVTDENKNTSLKISTLPDVYLHVFVSQREDIDLNQYMPYVNVIARTFVDFKFNFIIVINDTNVGWLSAEENNELALNMLWTRDKNVNQQKTSNHNINIEYMSLSSFMDNSPLRKVWRILPHQLIEFLARTVSIWDKGGVAFNPDILTPRFQHTLYIEKLQTLLNKYGHTSNVIKDFKLTHKLTKTSKNLKKMNNIQDIINGLEKEDLSVNAYSQQSLSEAEDREIQSIRHERHVPITADTKSKKNITSNTERTNSMILKTSNNTNGIFNQSTHNGSLEANNKSSKIGLLPLLFLEFLFHNKGLKSKSEITKTNNRTRKSIIINTDSDKDSTLSRDVLGETEKPIDHNFKPVIVIAPTTFNKSELYNVTNIPQRKETEQNLEVNSLTIDLKGNIIATDTSCHAFLGTIYSNVVHHNLEETITDFIIAELTIFCKGLLSSCMGIDLILL